MNEDPEVISNRLFAFLTQNKIAPDASPSQQPVNAYACAVAKLHKDPTGMRYLCCSSRYELKPLAIWINRSLRFLSLYAEKLWIQDFANVNIKVDSSWIMINSNRVRNMVTTLNTSIRRKDRKNRDQWWG